MSIIKSKYTTIEIRMVDPDDTTGVTKGLAVRLGDLLPEYRVAHLRALFSSVLVELYEHPDKITFELLERRE